MRVKMKLLKKHKKLSIFLLMCILFAVALGIFSNVINPDNPREKFFSCYSQDEADYARCIIIAGLEEDRGGCYGTYPLRTKDIRDGIRVDGDGAATCEGIYDENIFYFNKSGGFISKENNPQPNPFNTNILTEDGVPLEVDDEEL
jgi:hypothetical protein